MSDIQRDFTAAVGRLPGHLRALVSEAKSVRDTRGCWTLRDSDGVELVPVPQVSKAAPASGNRPVTSRTFMRVCEEIGALIGQVESRIAALESGGTKADTTRALPSGYITKVMGAPTKPRYRHHAGAWVVANGSDIWAATNREAAQ